jgi:ABC-type thiamine transport system substrate-binding protein
MLRRAVLVALCIGLGLAWGSSSAQISEGSKLVVYTYESFVAWGTGEVHQDRVREATPRH